MSDVAPLYDGHCHWHDDRLAPHRAAIDSALDDLPLAGAVVNGVRPGDWEAVAELANADSRVIPAFGLHPWWVNDAPPDWLECLREYQVRFPQAVVGEVGLDRWIKHHDLPKQQAALRAQLELAASDNRPLSIHCLQAWGPLLEILSEGPRPKRGFHLHGYGGSVEMVERFSELGGYFSFSAYIMHVNKARHREALRAVPRGRLLLETDAPDMLPPMEWQEASLPGMAAFEHAPEGGRLHHPANIHASYRAAADVLEMDLGDLRRLVASNFRRYFLA